MTLRKSIMLSLGMHLLLFGTGAAFARLAGVLPRDPSTPISVTLISAAGIPIGQTRLTAKSLPVMAATESILSAREQRPEAENPPPVDGAMQPDSDSSPVRQVTQEYGATKRPVGADNEQTDDGMAEAVSSVQWTLITSSIERAKVYPRLARERGIEGVVQVRFRLSPLGGVERVEIVKSSGFDVLDHASVSTVYRAAPMPYVKGWVAMPMKYVLK